MNHNKTNTVYSLIWQLILKFKNVDDATFLRPVYSEAVSSQQIQQNIKQFTDELTGFSALHEAVHQYHQFIKLDYEDLILRSDSWMPLLYFLIRIKKPSIIIETGCATGFTSSLMLYALQQNQRGHLYSIDLEFPSDWIVTNKLPRGFLVPDLVKSRWSLIRADTKIELPSLLKQLTQIDFFYHDSDHSYLHQMWEYLTAWPYLSPGGILLSDDLRHSTAMFDFARQVPELLLVTRRQHNVGMVVKRR